MNVYTYLVYFLIGYFAAAGSSKSHLRSSVDTPYRATALLNDSLWFGKAMAFYHYLPYDKPCTDKQFSLHILTDLPNGKEHFDHPSLVTGCMEQCVPTQALAIAGVPIRLGRYTLASLPICNGSPAHAAYTLLAGGDVSIADFEGHQGWLEVTKYTATSREIEGKFEVTLVSKEGELARFRQGVFRSKLTTY